MKLKAAVSKIIWYGHTACCKWQFNTGAVPTVCNLCTPKDPKNQPVSKELWKPPKKHKKCKSNDTSNPFLMNYWQPATHFSWFIGKHHHFSMSKSMIHWQHPHLSCLIPNVFLVKFHTLSWFKSMVKILIFHGSHPHFKGIASQLPWPKSSQVPHLKAIDVDHGEQNAAGAGRPQTNEDGDGDDTTAIQIPMTSLTDAEMLMRHLPWCYLTWKVVI